MYLSSLLGPPRIAAPLLSFQGPRGIKDVWKTWMCSFGETWLTRAIFFFLQIPEQARPVPLINSHKSPHYSVQKTRCNFIARRSSWDHSYVDVLRHSRPEKDRRNWTTFKVTRHRCWAIRQLFIQILQCFRRTVFRKATSLHFTGPSLECPNDSKKLRYWGPLMSLHWNVWSCVTHI